MTRARSFLLVGAALLALALAVGLQVGRDAAYPLRGADDQRLLYTRSGTAVKRMTLEFAALASDVYWIRAIQHYGGDRRTRDGRRRYELLQPLLDVTTTLDPYFTIAYRFGAIFLSEAPPGGPGRPDQAVALLHKGIAAEPHKWEYFHDVGFIYFWHLHEPATAAIWFQRAAAQPDAPSWLQPLAATVLSAGDRVSARILWQKILESDQAWLRRTAQRSLSQLQALDQIDELQAVIGKAALPAGRRVTWRDLVRLGVLPGMPVDPTGVPYQLDPDTAHVDIARSSTLSPLPALARPVR